MEIFIGSSYDNSKVVECEYEPGTSLEFRHTFCDTFVYAFSGKSLTVTRTDSWDGWGQELVGHVVPSGLDQSMLKPQPIANGTYHRLSVPGTGLWNSTNPCVLAPGITVFRLVNYSLDALRRFVPLDPGMPMFSNVYPIRSRTVLDTGHDYITLNWEVKEYTNLFRGVEDVRLVRHEDGSYTGTANVAAASHGYRRQTCILRGQKYTELQCERVVYGTHRSQKNWVPVQNRPSLLVYSFSPLIVLECGVDGTVTEFTNHRHEALPGGVKGSSPVVWDAEHGVFWCVVHQTYGNPRVYVHRLVMLDTRLQDVVKVSPWFVFQKLDVEFCCGLLLDNNTVTMSFGVNDAEAWTVTVPKKQLWNWADVL